MHSLIDVSKAVERLKQQRTPLVLTGAFIYLPTVVVLAGTGIFAWVTQAHVTFFLRDAKAVYGIPFHAGALSSIGILFWCATVSTCLLTAIVLYRSSSESDKRQFLLNAGLFTSILMLDDLFLIHEEFAPNYLNLDGGILYVTYAILAVSLLLYYRHVIYRSAYALLLLGAAFLAGSIAFDLLHEYGLLLAGAESRDLQHFLEDGCKLLGIAGWFSYFGWVSYGSLVRQSTTETIASPTVPVTIERQPSHPAARHSTRSNGSSER